MTEAVKKNKYCLMTEQVPYGNTQYLLCKLAADGSIKEGNWVELTEERAKEWMQVGIDVVEL